MKEIIETMPRIGLALIIIGVFVLILCLIFGYAMIHEYRMYLEDHRKARYSLSDFLKRERFYIFLLLASIFVLLTNLLYFLEWKKINEIIVAKNISLTLSANQKMMENNGILPPTSTDYKDSQDYNDCKFLGYTALPGKRQGSICHDEQVAYRPLIV